MSIGVIKSGKLVNGCEHFLEGRIPIDMRLAMDFMEMLDVYFTEQQRPEFYAGRMRLSLFRLNGILRHYYGRTIYELIQDRIHEEAVKLLMHTGMTIREITFSLGVCDPSWFTKCFREREGVNPKRFRKCTSPGSVR